MACKALGAGCTGQLFLEGCPDDAKPHSFFEDGSGFLQWHDATRAQGVDGGGGGEWVNRAFVIAPDGTIAARYDKMHMFDVQVSETETYRESSGYAPGGRAVLARTPLANIGLSICYDVRFAYLYRALAQAGAQVLTVPAAFSPGTGPMHWQPLLQARAIETGCYVLAPAQSGQHAAKAGRARKTYGHTMVISPWGEVLLDAGTEPGVFCVDLDMGAVDEARRKVPALTHDRRFEGPA